jgi:hypothetical protein
MYKIEKKCKNILSLLRFMTFCFIFIQTLGWCGQKTQFSQYTAKILQISDFAKKQDSNPLPHGDVAAGIAKMFAKFLLQKLDFTSKNTIFAIIRTDFCKIPLALSQKSDSAKNFFSIFANFSVT